MPTVGQIVRERREALGLTLQTVADEVGVTKGYLSMIENHRVNNPPARQHLEAIEQVLAITNSELIRAAEWENTPSAVRARFEKIAQQAKKGVELAHWLRQSTASRKGGAKNLDKLFRSGELSKRINSTLRGASRRAADVDVRVPVRYQVPLINKVATGYPRDFTDLDYPMRVADEYVAYPNVHDPQAFAARIVGDSMAPDYHEGDTVIFSPAARVVSGCDCFVRMNPHHVTTFKRIFFENGDIRLQPLNPRFGSETVKRERMAGFYRAVMKIQSLA